MKRLSLFLLPTILPVVLSFSATPARAQRIRGVAIAAPGQAAAPGKLPNGVLLPAGRQAQGQFRFQDSKGGIWGLNLNYGFIQESTNNVYGSGMYMHVQGNNFRSRNAATLNKAGDEVQIGPWSHQGLTVYRRIKVFRKEGIARWMEILHNPGPAKKVQVLLRTHMNYGIGSIKTSDGKDNLAKDTRAFITNTSANNTQMAILHILAGPRSKVLPLIQQFGNRFDVTYNISIPAGGTVILVEFEAQRTSNNSRKLVEELKKFRAHRFLRDLPSQARRLILNVRNSTGLDDVDLQREEHTDRVVLSDGQEFLGKIDTPKFQITTALGELILPAERVVGMAMRGNDPGQMRALLVDGQIVSGTVGEQTLRIDIPNIGVQTIPLEDIRSWSYRISKDRPMELANQGSYLRLRTGDRLAFDPKSISFQLQTREDVVDLDPSALLAVQLDNEDHNLHRVTFRNGSELSGLLLPKSVQPKLQLGRQQSIPREWLTFVEYAQEENIPENAPKLTLANGDVLLGRFESKEISLKGKYGPLKFQPESIRTFHAIPDRTGWFTATLWNGSTVRGRLEAPRLKFKIESGPSLEIATARIATFEQPNALPPQTVLQNVGKLIAQLGAESYKDRKDAQEKLIKMGPSIIPFLKKHLNNKDPEIRQRIQDILDQLSAVG